MHPEGDGVAVERDAAGCEDLLASPLPESGAEVVQFGTAEDDVVRAIAVDVWGGVHLAGYTTGAASGRWAHYGAPLGGRDGFHMRFDTAGVERSAAIISTAADDDVNGLALISGQHPVAVGGTKGDLLGDGSVSSSNFFNNAFVTRLAETNGEREWARLVRTDWGCRTLRRTRWRPTRLRAILCHRLDARSR